MTAGPAWAGLAGLLPAREVSAQVAEHDGMVQFGVFLRGPGRIALREPG